MFEQVHNKRVYEQVVSQIHEQIYSGNLSKGDQLPSEKELVEQLHVSRTSVRDALRALEVTGLIETKQGDGNYIKGEMDKSLMDAISAIFILNQVDPGNMVEFRSIIEVNACRLAAQRCTDEQATELERIVDALGDRTLEENKSKLDKELHNYIAEITGNPMIISVMAIISTVLERNIQTSRTKILELPENRERLFIHHEDIVRAIIDHDPNKAALAMEGHMALIKEIVLNA